MPSRASLRLPCALGNGLIDCAEPLLFGVRLALADGTWARLVCVAELLCVREQVTAIWWPPCRLRLHSLLGLVPRACGESGLLVSLAWACLTPLPSSLRPACTLKMGPSLHSLESPIGGRCVCFCWDTPDHTLAAFDASGSCPHSRCKLAPWPRRGLSISRKGREQSFLSELWVWAAVPLWAHRCAPSESVVR